MKDKDFLQLIETIEQLSPSMSKQQRQTLITQLRSNTSSTRLSARALLSEAERDAIQRLFT
ncbi:hypothetical protein [Thaumasiovibrio subtropicus]|uniref:hypothetical protein n=1 Tax=Thaumasiovibrio subtropicus TaxID=1891207 RepID=UPI000B36395B|nr:hypothetical protein [Thaumasiovibrio subtropicus]